MMWLAQSRKAKVALGSILSIVLARFLKHFGFTESDINVITGGIVALSGIWMASIAHEDGKLKAGPQNQTNVNSDVRNSAPPPTDGPLVTTPAPPPPTPQKMVVTFNPTQMEAIADLVVAKSKPPTDGPKGN